MGKNKLKRFADNQVFSNVFEPSFEESYNAHYRLKGKWNEEVFKNDRPIVLELGCGKGEYAVGQAMRFPDKNYIGVDIKGARLWRGAKTALERNIKNVAFLRTRIEFIESFFAKDEISEIWITFPDPQLKKRRVKKRLTSSLFLNRYKNFLSPEGVVHLKTDSAELYEYTNKLLAFNSQSPIAHTADLYKSDLLNDVLSIKTFYEQQYLEKGKPITYICFRLSREAFAELPVEEDEFETV